MAQRLVAGLSRRQGLGQCYRVDVDLRPEGSRGPLLNSVAGCEHYYEVWGQGWERLALVRARHLAGASWVSAALLAALRPFVYPRTRLSPVRAEVRAVAARMRAETRQAPPHSFHLKGDPGGIRAIELFVQALQTLHGGTDPSLRVARLGRALAALVAAGHLPATAGRRLGRAYQLFRALENALQAADDRQTYALPTDAGALAALAHHVGLAGDGEALATAVTIRRRQVARLVRPLWGPARPARTTPGPARRALSTTGEARRAALGALGFMAPAESADVLDSLTHAPAGLLNPGRRTSGRRAGGDTLAVALLRAAAQSPDPDQALRLYAGLDPALRRQPGYAAILARQPLVRRRLFDLLGTSTVFARTLSRAPDLIDWLLAARDPRQVAGRDGAAVRADLARQMGTPADLDDRRDALRRALAQEHLRLGLLDLAGRLPLPALEAQLTRLAETALEACLALAVAARPALAAAPDTFAVLGLGRLGAGEMGYGSDLDLMFVVDGDATAVAAATRLAQGLLAELQTRTAEGACYQVDTRLRPSGTQGPLVVSRRALLAYHAGPAALWERQALLRARPVAGCDALGAAVLRALAPARYPAALPAIAAASLTAMRARLAAAAGVRPGRHDIKAGPGGLVDVTFATQYLQLRHAHAHPGLQVTHTLTALRAAAAAGIVPAGEVAAVTRAYIFLRRLEGRLRVVDGRPLSAFDLAAPGARGLARRMQLGSTAALAARIARATATVRRFFRATL